jgi:hypothetical protein
VSAPSARAAALSAAWRFEQFASITNVVPSTRGGPGLGSKAPFVRCCGRLGAAESVLAAVEKLNVPLQSEDDAHT